MPFAVAGLAAGLALFSALTFWPTRAATRLWHLDGVARLFAFAACSLLGEGLRTWPFTGFPWNRLGAVRAYSAVPLHPAALAGIWLLLPLTLLAVEAPGVRTATSAGLRGG